MTDNPNKKSLWDKIHIDPAMLLILLALLVYSALVIWSASGQDIGMMERKIGQIAMGLVIMVVMAQIPPACTKAGRPTSIFSVSSCLLRLMPLVRYPRAHSAGWIWGSSASSRRKSRKSPYR